jgi:hypothetical protein
MTDIPIQDVGPSNHDVLKVPVYHVHGYRQYLGTCKLHASPDCRHFAQWRPGLLLGKVRMGKVIMRDWETSLDSIPPALRCKTCWPKPKATNS